MATPSQPHPAALPVADLLEFETLISDMSALLMAALPERVEPAIDEALDQVRTFFRADRCGVLTVGENEQIVRVLQASYAPGVSHVSGDIDLGQLFPGRGTSSSSNEFRWSSVGNPVLLKVTMQALPDGTSHPGIVTLSIPDSKIDVRITKSNYQKVVQ